MTSWPERAPAADRPAGPPAAPPPRPRGRHRRPDDDDEQNAATAQVPAAAVESIDEQLTSTGRHHLRIAADPAEADRLDAERFGPDRAPGRHGALATEPRVQLAAGQPHEILLPPGPDTRPFDEPGPAAPTPRAPSRAGRNLPAAIGVGLVLGALIIASLLLYRPSFLAVIGVAVVLAVYEIATAIATVEARPPIVPLVVGALAMGAAAWTRGTSGLAVATLLTVCGLVIWRLADGAAGYLRDLSSAVLILLYVPMLAGFAVLLAHPHDGAARVITFIGLVVCSDTGGYTAGVLLGRHPLAPTVSKGKTWEGVAGSVLFGGVAGALIMDLTFHQQWWKGVLLGLAVVVGATLGDLGESMIKRDLGLKDMGRLLPGHGGVMDRLDSLLPCAVIAYLVLSAFTR